MTRIRTLLFPLLASLLLLSLPGCGSKPPDPSECTSCNSVIIPPPPGESNLTRFHPAR